jgi:hypothetical protein
VSGVQPPPPGWQPEPTATPSPWSGVAPPSAPYPGPSYPRPGGPAGPAGPRGPVAPLPVAHRPGAIPLRPLVLSDIFDGAFRIIRYNPRATIGAAVLVSAVAMVVPVGTALVTGVTGGLSPDPATGTLSDTQIYQLLTALAGFLAGAQLQAIGLLFVSGMIAHVTSAAAVGQRLSLGQAWAATRGKRWRLLGMAFLLGLGATLVLALAVALVVVAAVVFKAPLGWVLLFALFMLLAVMAAYLWYWVRLRALAVPVLMLEPVGVFGALRRAVRLTRRQFWRLLGLLLLVTLVVGVAGSILRLPFSITGELFLTRSSHSGDGLVIYLLLTGVGTVVSSAVLQPFSAVVSALLYVDQRIRKEAYDVELLDRAGILPS